MYTTRQVLKTEMELTQTVVQSPGGLLLTLQYVPTTRYTDEIVLADVYRVLRSDEKPQNGITAKDPNSIIGAAYHVAWGSDPIKKEKSKYISTCQLLKDAERMAHIHLNNFREMCTIVQIDLHRWKKEENAPYVREIIPVWDINERMKIIHKEKPDIATQTNFHRFADINDGFQEVLLVGYVPKEYLTVLQWLF